VSDDTSQQHAAARGAVDGRRGRRHFLAAGGSLLMGWPLAGSASAPEAGPPWTRQPGGADAPYGLPSELEAGVVRHLSPDAPGFAIWHTPLERLRGILTPSGLHFAVHHNGIPAIDPQRHQLVIHGLVERALRFDLERLERYPMVSRIHFLECSGNTAANALSPFAKDLSAQELSGQVSCSEWTGVPLSVLLREAGVKPAAQWAIVEGADGGTHQRSLPVTKLMDDAFIALYQNGERLRPSQGYPMRLFVPGWEGNVNVKWVHRIELSDQPAHTKDEAGLYTEVLVDGRIERFSFTMEVKSLITHPSGRHQLKEPFGYQEISGLAWSGRGRITRVEVSVDGGRGWADARLEGPVLPKAFTRFSLPWRWDGRPATLMSRAHDEQGRVQPTRAAWKARYAAHAFNHYNAIQAWRVHKDGRVENVYA
jgi:sulfane dehydrogenase subunit SoxC